MNKTNNQVIVTKTLTDLLSVDLLSYTKSQFPKVLFNFTLSDEEFTHLGFLQRMRLIIDQLYENGVDYKECAVHPSDIIRSFAPGIIAKISTYSLQDKINAVKSIADDAHFNVREFAWLLLREDLIEEISLSVQLLSDWVFSSSENIRRFAIEGIRPRGVWCKHCNLLKKDPSLALPLLDPLYCDPSRYVQLSVGNWLNDASKSKPEWVIALTDRWLQSSNDKSTQYICKRALRTIRKKTFEKTIT